MLNQDVLINIHPYVHTQNRRKLEKNNNTSNVGKQLFFIVLSTKCESS